jgi:hypothetical protein
VCPAETVGMRVVPSKSFTAFSGPPLTLYTRSSVFTP